MADEPSNLLAITEGIDRCADAAADSIVSRSPELNRAAIKAAIAYELWLAIGEVTELARAGAMLV